MRVENVTLVAAFRIGCWTEKEKFPQVAGGNVEPSPGRFGERGHLRRACFQQIDKAVLAQNGKYMAAVASSDQQASSLVESQRISEVITRGPNPGWRAIRSDFVDL